MADPKLQIEQRVERVEDRLNHQETAIRTITNWLVNEYPSFDASVVDAILNGEETEESKEE